MLSFLSPAGVFQAAGASVFGFFSLTNITTKEVETQTHEDFILVNSFS